MGSPKVRADFVVVALLHVGAGALIAALLISREVSRWGLVKHGDMEFGGGPVAQTVVVGAILTLPLIVFEGWGLARQRATWLRALAAVLAAVVSAFVSTLWVGFRLPDATNPVSRGELHVALVSCGVLLICHVLMLSVTYIGWNRWDRGTPTWEPGRTGGWQ